MQAGDTVQVLQLDHAILRKGEEPTPGQPHWIYATVIEVLPKETAAYVEVSHPGNLQHGQRMLVSRKNLRTAGDLQKLHDAHPHRDVKQLSYENEAHKPLINIRVALGRCNPNPDA